MHVDQQGDLIGIYKTYFFLYCKCRRCVGVNRVAQNTLNKAYEVYRKNILFTFLMHEKSSIKVVSVKTYKHHYSITYSIDEEFEHVTTVLYDADVDLHNVPSECATFVALFESLKFMILLPSSLDVREIGPIAPEMAKQFQEIIPKLWNQHMHENDLTHWKGPELVYEPLSTEADRHPSMFFPTVTSPESILVFNGGGKDSLLVSEIIDSLGSPYGVMGHSRSEYGRHSEQHYHQERLAIEGMCGATGCYRVKVYDTLTDGEFVKVYYPHLRGECTEGRPCQVGTPEMLFYALPYAYLHGYTHFALGWERSSSSNQLMDEDEAYMNHQWLKSLEAEQAYGQLLAIATRGAVQVFSPLRGIGDRALFRMLHPLESRIHLCHSCNVSKPWCFSCPKCMYVWLHYLSVFSRATVERVFGDYYSRNGDASDASEGSRTPEEAVINTHAALFRQLLGMEGTNALECVGETRPSCYALMECISACKLRPSELPSDIVKHVGACTTEAEPTQSIESLLEDVHHDFQARLRKVFMSWNALPTRPKTSRVR